MVRKCGEDIEKFAFNTYISALHKFMKPAIDAVRDVKADDRATVLALSEAAEFLVLVIAPAAPHSGDELWSALGKEGFTYNATWPKFDPELAKDEMNVIAYQVNGKLRDTIEMPADASQEELVSVGMASSKVQTHFVGVQIRKTIVVPNKLVNFVVN
jgi:leucyl-tRNA synthetase